MEYSFRICTLEDFDFLFRKTNGKLENVAQKFHSLLSQGISMNLGVTIPVLSCPPANIGKLYAKTDTSKFYYIPVLKFPGLNYLLVWGYMLFFALFWNIGHLFSKRIVYISATTLLKFLPVYIISKLFFAKLVMITCDIPKMTFTQRISHKSTSFKDKIHSFFTNFVWRIASHFNYYVFLTEKMSDVVNTHNRPYTVVEGFSDIRMNKEENRLEQFLREANGEIIEERKVPSRKTLDYKQFTAQRETRFAFGNDPEMANKHGKKVFENSGISTIGNEFKMF